MSDSASNINILKRKILSFSSNRLLTAPAAHYIQIKLPYASFTAGRMVSTSAWGRGITWTDTSSPTL